MLSVRLAVAHPGEKLDANGGHFDAVNRSYHRHSPEAFKAWEAAQAKAVLSELGEVERSASAAAAFKVMLGRSGVSESEAGKAALAAQSFFDTMNSGDDTDAALKAVLKSLDLKQGADELATYYLALSLALDAARTHKSKGLAAQSAAVGVAAALASKRERSRPVSVEILAAQDVAAKAAAELSLGDFW